MLDILVNLLGLGLIAGIVWWFWLAPKRHQPKAVEAQDKLRIVARDGVYEPDRIRIKAGEAVTLHFYRQDPTPCAAWVLFPDLEVSAQLAVNEETLVKIPATESGEYPFHCQMQMYRGTLLVE
ncbi:cupredoxin domain-containing protein [Microbulbifer sp. SH-1]|uniref:cupredoxin domain-containing protein n=1 Tax=Microbulbifer sp. SH-1 TaxID=2681547 RepID=UPI00140DD1F8|nr:cupredoxin domain-containing protein [Microbulbifer sp. SH-1]QIL90260.1 cupredoxin domain-containing protein [Microbulbifer sp. SH-1]